MFKMFDASNQYKQYYISLWNTLYVITIVLINASIVIIRYKLTGKRTNRPSGNYFNPVVT